MTVIVFIIGRDGDRLEVNGQDKGSLNEDGLMVDVDEGESTFAAYEDETLVSESTENIIDLGEPITIDLRPAPEE